jgi:hypothetical protein
MAHGHRPDPGARNAGLPADLPGVSGPFDELLRRSGMFIFEFGLATQRSDEPVRTDARPPLDKERLEVVERLFRNRFPRSRNGSRASACLGASSASTSSTTATGHCSPTISAPTSTPSAARRWPATRARDIDGARIARLRNRYMPGLRPLRD